MFLQKVFGRSFPALMQPDPNIVIQGRHENAHRTVERIRLEASACTCSWISDVMNFISMYRAI